MKEVLAIFIALIQWSVGSAAFYIFSKTPASEENAVMLAVSFCLSLLISVPFFNYAIKYWEGVLRA
jgi:hypothetical protein